MKFRKLGKTDLDVSVIGLGTWQFGGEWGREYSAVEADSIIKTASDLGINLIDTAECYGDHLSEQLVGKAVVGTRDKWIIATKFGHHFHGPFDRTMHYSPKEVRVSLEESLKSLKTDYIDLLQFHSGDNEAFDTPGLWDELSKLKKEGKIRHFGISIGNVKKHRYQIEQAASVGAETFQVIYNRLEREPEELLFPTCERENLGILARVPLASGFLSGKYKPGYVFENKNDVRSRHNQDEVESRLREVQNILKEEVPEGCDMASWALAWCLRNPLVSAVIPGCKDPDQVVSNAAAVNLL